MYLSVCVFVGTRRDAKFRRNSKASAKASAKRLEDGLLRVEIIDTWTVEGPCLVSPRIVAPDPWEA